MELKEIKKKNERSRVIYIFFLRPVLLNKVSTIPHSTLYAPFSQSYDDNRQRWDRTNGQKTSIIIDQFRNGKTITIEGGTSTGDTSIGGSDLHLVITANHTDTDRAYNQTSSRGGGGGGGVSGVSCGGQTPPTPTIGKTLLNTSPNLLPITTATDAFNNLKNLFKIEKATTSSTSTSTNNGGSNYRIKNNIGSGSTYKSNSPTEPRNSVGRTSGGPSGHFSTGYNKNSAKIRQHDSEVSPRPRRSYQSDSSSSRYYNKNSDNLGQNISSQQGLTGNAANTDTYNGGRYSIGERDHQQNSNGVHRGGRNYHQSSDGNYNRNINNSTGGGGGGGNYRSQQHNLRYENGNGNGQQRSYGNSASNAGYNNHNNQNNSNIKSSYGSRNTNDGNVTGRSNHREEYGNNYRERDFEDSAINQRYSGGNTNSLDRNNHNHNNNSNNNSNNGGGRYRSNIDSGINSNSNNLPQSALRNEDRYERSVNNRTPPTRIGNLSGPSVSSSINAASNNINNVTRGISPPISGASNYTNQQQTVSSGSGSTPPPAAGRWIPPSLRPQHGLTQSEKNDAVFRKVRGILNKLTPEKFQELSDELLKLDLNSIVILNGVILLIFDKALDEPKYSSMYAQLCKRLSEEAPSFEKDPNNSCTFLRLLIAVCRDKFNNRLKKDEPDNRPPPENEADEEERRHLAKQRMLGNVKFIGELNKLDMLSKNVLHQCIMELLDKKKKRTAGAQEMCEDMECLAQLLKTCGKNLDSEQGKELMNQYFETLERRSKSTEYPPRIRFMLKDVIELRENNWIPRKVGTTEGPVPIKQIRSDDDALIRTPFANRNRDMRNNDRDSDSWMNRIHLNWQPGYNDMFSSLSVTGSSPIVSPFATSANNGRDNNRQYNNRDRNNQGNNYANRYNKHNQNGNGNRDDNRNAPHMIRDQNGSQYGGNQLLNNKELAPRFKRNLIATNQEGVENLQMRPAPNSLLFRAATQNQKLPTTLPITTPPNSTIHNKEQTQLSNTQYPLLGTPTSHFITPVRPSSTPSAEYAENNAQHANQPNATERGLKPTSSTPNFGVTPAFVAEKPTSSNANNTDNSQNVEKKSSTPAENNNNNKQANSLTKNGSTERPITPTGNGSAKQKKDKGVNKEEMLKKATSYFKEKFYYNTETLTEDESTVFGEFVDGFIELKIPEKCMKDVCINLIMEVLDRVNDVYVERVVRFMQTLRKQSNIKPNIAVEVFKQIVNKMNEREALNPRITTMVSIVLSKAVCEPALIKLNDIANYTDNGQHYPLFLLVLQQLHKSIGKDALEEKFRNSKINLMNNLQEADRNKERLAEILEERQLTFLYPLLKVQSEMLKQLNSDPNPGSFYKWIKANVDTKYYKEAGFIESLMTVVVKYITKETTLAEGADIKKHPDKSITEKEEALLISFSQILQNFLGQNDLQLIALYALQVFCYNENFPKGMLCRWFKYLYEAEVIEEEAFLTWKEELCDTYPGKQSALFQVNAWLTWLQEAESEDDED